MDKSQLLWCSIHQPTATQLAELAELGELTFLKDIAPEIQDKINNCPSDRDELADLITSMVDTAQAHDINALIQLGGSPLFIAMTGQFVGVSNMLFSHSERVSTDEPQPDGSIKKVSTFNHVKFI